MSYLKFYLYSISVSGIIWIMFSFLVSNLQKSTLIFPQIIKVIVAYHLYLVYYLYS